MRLPRPLVGNPKPTCDYARKDARDTVRCALIFAEAVTSIWIISVTISPRILTESQSNQIDSADMPCYAPPHRQAGPVDVTVRL
jgi:hypothetical protein